MPSLTPFDQSRRTSTRISGLQVSQNMNIAISIILNWVQRTQMKREDSIAAGQDIKRNPWVPKCLLVLLSTEFKRRKNMLIGYWRPYPERRHFARLIWQCCRMRQLPVIIGVLEYNRIVGCHAMICTRDILLTQRILRMTRRWFPLSASTSGGGRWSTSDEFMPNSISNYQEDYEGFGMRSEMWSERSVIWASDFDHLWSSAKIFNWIQATHKYCMKGLFTNCIKL